jgi:transcriptional regulator with XRE-family HTH domain
VLGLGAAIRGARQAAGLSRAQLADRAKVSHVFIGKIESGKRNPSPPTLGKIAAALAISPGELLTRAELIDANEETQTDELKRRLVRAVAVSAGVRAALPLIGLAPIAASAAASLALELAKRQDGVAGAQSTSARERLQMLVGLLPEADAQAILTAVAAERDEPIG